MYQLIYREFSLILSIQSFSDRVILNIYEGFKISLLNGRCLFNQAYNARIPIFFTVLICLLANIHTESYNFVHRFHIF